MLCIDNDEDSSDESSFLPKLYNVIQFLIQDDADC